MEGLVEQSELLAELTLLRQEVENLRQEKADLEMILEFTTEHSTNIETGLNEENKAVRRELQIGRQIQSDFLPEELPQMDGWELATRFRPAREVAGDFYDAFLLPEGRFGVVVADVCDKGVGAALFMALTRSLLRVLALQANLRMQTGLKAPVISVEGQVVPPDIAEVLQAVTLTNDYITATHGRSEMFATLFFGVLNIQDGLLYYVNGGHDAPIIVAPHGAGIKDRLKRTGPPVGSIAGVKYKIRQCQIKPGETFLAYTDGIPEAQNREEVLFGEQHLLALVTQLSLEDRIGSEEISDTILARVKDHVGKADPSDDITMLVLHRLAAEDAAV